jgi:hypothetical protein
MSLFKKAELTTAYLKMGIMGFAGAGKTHTATLVGIGLHKMLTERLGEAKPVFFLDTETGSDWIKPQFDAAGIELMTAKTRAFKDLMAATAEAEKNGSILIVDSITHFWTELCDSYQKAKKRNRLQFEDWGYLKKEWRRFTDLFINSRLHIILCGRAGYEYDYFEDEAGKKQLEKTGIKMKAEGEMGYEPSILVLMEREMDLDEKRVYRVAHILKDRSTRIDGKSIENPTFASFLPHIKYLNIGGEQLGVDTTRSSEDTIPGDKERRDLGPVRRKIVLDEIKDLMTLTWPGQAAAEKKAKIEALQKYWNAGWVEMEEVMPWFDLVVGYDMMHRDLLKKPSRYASEMAAEGAKNEALNDEIPEAAE